MADNDGSKIGMLGVLIGALIVVLVGGGILYATGALDSKPTSTNVTIRQPAPAATPAAPDRRGDWRDDRRGGRDDDRRDRDGPGRR